MILNKIVTSLITRPYRKQSASGILLLKKDSGRAGMTKRANIISVYIIGRNGRSEAGFTLVELMVTMVAFVLVISAASQMFTSLLTQFKQQSKIAETSIEGIVGLNILRQDISHAGLGLPWNVTGIVDSNGDDNIDFLDVVPDYSETAEAGYSPYNDAPNNPPSAFRSGDGAGPVGAGSDYLVIKSASASTDIAAGKNTRLTSALPPDHVRNWGLYTEDLENTDRVIVLSPGNSDDTFRSLIVTGGSYQPQYSTVASYSPADNTDVRMVYGISSSGTLRAPFNRSDYYISANNVPRCAAGTGVLVRATLVHSTGRFTEMPILDCVADFQVVYAMDNDEDGDFENGVGGDAYTNSLAGLTAEMIRTRVKEVQVYILAHEGQRDPSFTFNNFTGACDTCMLVGRSNVFGHDDFDLSNLADFDQYRWKLYTLAVQTENLR
ncbi:MAG: prepilin-type N-terminal cleavage/methylation domain-containing protein [Nitrospiraceae bacterium]|nr:MAG: prepilin-type N-terminal cleavage/methylation domain-containing protein [Nitrospiraceae bacterium]